VQNSIHQPDQTRTVIVRHLGTNGGSVTQRRHFSFLLLFLRKGRVLSGLALAALALVTARSRTRDSSEIILRFGGDVLLAVHYEQDVGSDIHRAFEGFDLFHTDDLSMVNLEAPLTERGTRQVKPYTFRMKQRCTAALTRAGIDVVNLANNHIFDYGTEGLFDTITALDSAHILYVGAGRNAAQAHRPIVKTFRSKTIGLLGYYGGPESPKASASSPGVADRNLALIERDVRHLREVEHAEYVVVNFHWGDELADFPAEHYREFAHRVITFGVDAIIGHHPHVLQGIELYQGKVIVYSLGNLIFGGNAKRSYDTGVFEIRLTHSGPAYRFIPVRVSHWQASVLTGADAERLVARVRRLSAIFPSSIFQ